MPSALVCCNPSVAASICTIIALCPQLVCSAAEMLLFLKLLLLLHSNHRRCCCCYPLSWQLPVPGGRDSVAAVTCPALLLSAAVPLTAALTLPPPGKANHATGWPPGRAYEGLPCSPPGMQQHCFCACLHRCCMRSWHTPVLIAPAGKKADRCCRRAVSPLLHVCLLHAALPCYKCCYMAMMCSKIILFTHAALLLWAL
jgi:hypothetical protein